MTPPGDETRELVGSEICEAAEKMRLEREAERLAERVKRYKTTAAIVAAGLLTAAALVYDYATLHARVGSLEARHQKAAPPEGGWWPWGG